MSEIWFISDTHFGHTNMLKFTDAKGALIRPDFVDANHMDETIVERWNARVGPNDKVYHLGDVGICSQKRLDELLPRLNGHKRLILGNHDNEDVKFYRKHFQKVASWRHFTDAGVAIICTHFPLHSSSFLGRYDGACLNVHGHIHARQIPDARYCNVCVEITNYAPVHYDTLIRAARQIKEAAE